MKNNCTPSLTEFVKMFRPLGEPGDNGHIGAICDHLEAAASGDCWEFKARE